MKTTELNAISRLTDTCTGHGCFPSRPIIETTHSFYYVQSLLVSTIDAKLAVHCCGLSCHDGGISTGSSFYNIENIPVGRVGDGVDCGSRLKEGSEWYFVHN